MSECKCGMRTKLVGDGCEVCNPAKALDYAKQTIADLEQERDALAARVAELEKDAAFGRIAMRFVDRAGDYCPEDPAERICDEFEAAIAAEVDRQTGVILRRRREGLPDADSGRQT